MGNDTFILDSDGNVIPEPDSVRFGEWFDTHVQERIVVHTRIAPNETVCTVFLGLDQRFGKNEPSCQQPLLWETTIFGGPLDGKAEHYSSRDAALIGHERMVKWAQRAHARDERHCIEGFH